MKLKDFINKINFMDNNYYFRFYFDKNIVYVSATDLKEEGITGIIHSLSMDVQELTLTSLQEHHSGMRIWIIIMEQGMGLAIF